MSTESFGRKTFCFIESDWRVLAGLMETSKGEVGKGKSFKMVSKEIATNTQVIIQTMMKTTKMRLLEKC